MKWLKLKDVVVGSGAIYLFGCESNEQAWQVKRRLKEQRPHAVILYAGPYSKIKEYQATHWVKDYGGKVFHNYQATGYRQNVLTTALESLQSALQLFARQYHFIPAEVVLVRT